MSGMKVLILNNYWINYHWLKYILLRFVDFTLYFIITSVIGTDTALFRKQRGLDLSEVTHGNDADAYLHHPAATG